MPDHSAVQARRDNRKKKHRSMEARMKYLYGPCTKEHSLAENPMLRAYGCNYEKRKITDIFCLVFFAGTVAAMVGFSIYALTFGNINKVIGGMDGAGNMCGVKDQGKAKVDFTDYPFVYVSNLQLNHTDNILESAVCVNFCPKGVTPPKCLKNSLFAPKGNCFNYKDLKGSSEYTAMYASEDVLGYCIPVEQCQVSGSSKASTAASGASSSKGGCIDTQSQAGYIKFRKAIFSSGTGQYIKDIKASSTSLIATFITGFIYSTILLYFMSMFAETIAWFCIIITQLGLVGGCLIAILKRSEALALVTTSGMGDSSKSNAMGGNNHVNAFDMQRYALFMMFAAIFMGIFALMFLVLMFSQFKHIKTAINVIEASAEFMIGNKRVVFLPFIYFAVTIIGILLWAYCLAAIVSLNDVISDQGVVKINFKPQQKKINWNVTTEFMMVFMIIGQFWFFLWIQYSSKFVVMCSAATYYFNSDVDDEGTAEVLLALKMTHVYHTGTIAFGSFAITLISIIRFAFTYWAKKAVLLSKENSVMNALVCCSECGLKCVETITDYLTLNAFAYIAITGDGFCEGAWKGFLLQIKHMLEFQHSMTVTLIFVSMAKFMIVILNIITGWFIMYDITGSGFKTTTHWVPFTCVAVFSYLIASLFLSIFSTVARTLMMCLAVDMDLNNGKPEFGPVSFHSAMHIVKTHNKKSGGYVQKKGEDVEEDLISDKASSLKSAPTMTPIDNGDHENLF